MPYSMSKNTAWENNADSKVCSILRNAPTNANISNILKLAAGFRMIGILEQFHSSRVLENCWRMHFQCFVDWTLNTESDVSERGVNRPKIYGNNNRESYRNGQPKTLDSDAEFIRRLTAILVCKVLQKFSKVNSRCLASSPEHSETLKQAENHSVQWVRASHVNVDVLFVSSMLQDGQVRSQCQTDSPSECPRLQSDVHHHL